MIMDKQTFLRILEAALLNWDGVAEQELIHYHGINTHTARAGVKLREYLQQLNIEGQNLT
jgi:hypothetical protein